MLTEASSPWQSTPQLLSHHVWMTRLTKTRFQGLSRIGGKQGGRAEWQSRKALPLESKDLDSSPCPVNLGGPTTLISWLLDAIR